MYSIVSYEYENEFKLGHYLRSSIFFYRKNHENMWERHEFAIPYPGFVVFLQIVTAA